MAYANELDPRTGKRRTLANIAASGQYPGAIAPILPKLAALLPSGSNAPFADNPNFIPSQPYFGGKADRPIASAATPNPPPLAPQPLAAQPLAPQPAANPNYGMNDRGAGYAQPLAQAAMQSRPQSVTAQPVNTIQSTQAPVAPGPNFDLAGQNARMQTALASTQQEGGYRGPMAPGRGIAGDFDFATNAAAEFAARSGDRNERAKLPGLLAAIKDRDAAARGDVANKAYADNALTQAQAGETTGRTKNAAALVPSEIGLKQSQAQENLARVPLSLAQAGEATARGNATTQLLPSQIGLNQANAGEATARGGLYGAQAGATTQDAENRSLLAPGAFEQQRQMTKKGALDLKSAQDLDTLRQGALAGDPKASKAFAQYMKANAGKGDGSVTEEDIITAFVNDRKAQAANPNPGAPQSYAEFKAAIMGTGGTPKMTDGQTYKDANGKPFKWVNGKAQAI